MVIVLCVAIVCFVFAIFAIKVASKMSEPSVPISVSTQTDSEIEAKQAHIRACQVKTARLSSRLQDLEMELLESTHALQKWQAVEKAAVETGVETNVREAVKQRLGVEQKIKSLKEELLSTQNTINELQGQLNLAKDKIDYSKAKALGLQARLESAKVREELADDEGPIPSLSALEEETIKAEAKAQANEEVSAFQQDFNRKNKVSSNDVDAEVERLMKKK